MRVRFEEDRVHSETMPRRRSDDKRAAILRAAVTVIAQRGLSAAPTSAISREAGIAEGTLFTYFPTKNDLANALFRELKDQLAAEMFSKAVGTTDVRSLIQHHWNIFVRWGIAHPESLHVIDQLSASGLITPQTLEACAASYRVVEDIIHAAIRQGTLRKLPIPMLSSTFEAMAQNTIRLINSKAGRPAQLRRLGFEMFWRAIAASSDS